MHAGVAVAVGHEIRAVRRDDDVGRQVERAAAMGDLFPRGRAVIVVGHAGVGARVAHADGLQQLAVGGELEELAVMLVGEPDVVVLVDADRVRKLEHPGAPRADELAVAVEDHDRMLGVAVEAEHPVLQVDRDRAGPDLDTVGGTLPFRIGLVPVLAAADDRVHFPRPFPQCRSVWGQYSKAVGAMRRVRSPPKRSPAPRRGEMLGSPGPISTTRSQNQRSHPMPDGGSRDTDLDRADLAMLEKLNRDYISSVQNGDVRRFDEILAAEFYCSNPDASLVDRAGFLKQTAQPVTISGLEAREVKIRLFRRRGDHPCPHRLYHRRRAGQVGALYRCLGAPERELAGGVGARHPRLSLEPCSRAHRLPPEPDRDRHCRRFP